MNINDLLEELEKELEESSNLPLTGKKIVDKDYILDIINDIRESLPTELSQARAIVQEKQRILLEAQKEADTMLKDVEGRIASMIDEHEIMQKAYEQSQIVLENAHNNATEIRLGAQTYADEILEDVERYLNEYREIIQKNRAELRQGPPEEQK